VKLASTSSERDLYDSLAEVHSIVITLEALERAYLKDSIAATYYTDTCGRLLQQYKSNLADETVSKAFGDLESFKSEWNVRCSARVLYMSETYPLPQIECPRATERIRIGLPATVEQPAHNAAASGSGANATLIVAASENFITLLDAIKIGMVSKDTLHPILVETIQAVNKVTSTEFENKGKIVQWLITLNQMRAAEELNQDQARELQFDMERAYYGFKATLE